jgi:hypothetical protein
LIVRPELNFGLVIAPEEGRAGIPHALTKSKHQTKSKMMFYDQTVKHDRIKQNKR